MSLLWRDFAESGFSISYRSHLNFVGYLQRTMNRESYIMNQITAVLWIQATIL